MTDEETKKERVETVAVRWFASLITAVAFGLVGIIWANLTGQISELKIDTSGLKKDVWEMRMSVQKMEGRIDNLVATLNQREEAKQKVAR